MVLLPRQTTLTIGASVSEVSPELGTGQRVLLSLTNASAGGQVISLAWGQDAVANSGVVLYPGASWSESIDAKFTPLNSRITAIASLAGATLAVLERVENGR
jgi:hypothetical protein